MTFCSLNMTWLFPSSLICRVGSLFKSNGDCLVFFSDTQSKFTKQLAATKTHNPDVSDLSGRQIKHIRLLFFRPIK